MQNIKNFKIVKPTKKQLKALASDDGVSPLFLKSESGHDWYECQALFADDTVKLEYDVNGVIYRVVDKPVPERGNTLAVSMLWPENASVAEVESLPDGFSTDGTWIYSDGEVIQQAENVVAKNKRSLRRRVVFAASTITMLQSCAGAGTSQEGDEEKIQIVQQYMSDLRAVDLSQSQPVWPAIPDFMN